MEKYGNSHRQVTIDSVFRRQRSWAVPRDLIFSKKTFPRKLFINILHGGKCIFITSYKKKSKANVLVAFFSEISGIFLIYGQKIHFYQVWKNRRAHNAISTLLSFFLRLLGPSCSYIMYSVSWFGCWGGCQLRFLSFMMLWCAGVSLTREKLPSQRWGVMLCECLVLYRSINSDTTIPSLLWNQTLKLQATISLANHPSIRYQTTGQPVCYRHRSEYRGASAETSVIASWNKDLDQGYRATGGNWDRL